MIFLYVAIYLISIIFSFFIGYKLNIEIEKEKISSMEYKNGYKNGYNSGIEFCKKTIIHNLKEGKKIDDNNKKV